MRVIIDTNIWSLMLRRLHRDLTRRERALSAELEELVGEGRAMLLGMIRQELLSGIVRQDHFEALRQRLRQFDDEPITSADHEHAAACFSGCRAQGVQGGPVDMLICAVAERRRASVFTLDRDFVGYAKPLGFSLHAPRR